MTFNICRVPDLKCHFASLSNTPTSNHHILEEEIYWKKKSKWGRGEERVYSWVKVLSPTKQLFTILHCSIFDHFSGAGRRRLFHMGGVRMIYIHIYLIISCSGLVATNTVLLFFMAVITSQHHHLTTAVIIMYIARAVLNSWKAACWRLFYWREILAHVNEGWARGWLYPLLKSSNPALNCRVFTHTMATSCSSWACITLKIQHGEKMHYFHKILWFCDMMCAGLMKMQMRFGFIKEMQFGGTHMNSWKSTSWTLRAVCGLLLKLWETNTLFEVSSGTWQSEPCVSFHPIYSCC